MLLFLTLYQRSKIIVVNKSLYRVSQKHSCMCMYGLVCNFLALLLANLDRGKMFISDETKKYEKILYGLSRKESRYLFWLCYLVVYRNLGKNRVCFDNY
jgi:hypothetical protein